MKAFDPNKPCQYEDGVPSRIICTDRQGDYPIVALRPLKRGKELITTHRLDGTSDGCSDNLVNVNVLQKKLWVVSWKGWENINLSEICFSEEEAGRVISGRVKKKLAGCEYQIHEITREES